ncbi:MAG: alpha/beta hydrolase [Pseudomonadota bacterium]
MSLEAPLYHELANAPAHGRAFRFKAGRRELRGAVWDGGARGVVYIFTGRTEYIEKYGRVIAALAERGFSVATLDWRGQGLSARALNDPLKGHVADFAAYQNDVKAFLATPDVAALSGPQVLLCHSMGGCIGMRALLEERITPTATIMSAPMLGIFLKPHLRLAAKAMVALARRFGFETASTPAPGGGRPYVLGQSFEGNVLTGDAEHYGWMRRHLEAEPAFGLGAPTLGWMGQSFDEMAALAAAPAPAGPMLMFLGDDEEVVDPAAIRAHDAKSPECRLVELADARHEVFMETPSIRKAAWSEIDRFLADQGV